MKTYHAEPDETFHTVRQLLLELSDESTTLRGAMKIFILLHKYHPVFRADMRAAINQYDGDER
jgi:hypothetical protein